MAQVSKITGLNGAVGAIAFSPDGKTIAAADSGSDLTLWEKSSGKPLATFSGLFTGSTSINWSPDGKTVFGTAGNEWIAWDVKTGSEKLKVKGEMERTTPRIINLSDDGKMVVAAGNGRFKVWSAIDGKPLAEYEVHPNYSINSVAFSPDGKSIVTTANDRTAQVTDIDDGTGMTYTCGNRALAAAFSPDGKTLFIIDQQPLLHCIDLKSGVDTPAAPIRTTPKQMSISPDGKYVACAAVTVQLWSVMDQRWYETRLANSVLGIVSIAFSPDGKTVAGGDAEGQIHFWTTKELLAAK